MTIFPGILSIRKTFRNWSKYSMARCDIPCRVGLVIVPLIGLPLAGLGVTAQSLALILMGVLLLVLSYWDMKTRLLPDHWVYVLLWTGLLVNCSTLFASPQNAVIGACTGYLLLMLLRYGYWWLFHREGLGGGDAKLMAALGAWGGVDLLPYMLMIASISGGCVFICFISTGRISVWQRRRDRHNKTTPGADLFSYRLPFGPCLAIGGWITLVMTQNALWHSSVIDTFQ